MAAHGILPTGPNPASWGDGALYNQMFRGHLHTYRADDDEQNRLSFLLTLNGALRTSDHISGQTFEAIQDMEDVRTRCEIIKNTMIWATEQLRAAQTVSQDQTRLTSLTSQPEWLLNSPEFPKLVGDVMQVAKTYGQLGDPGHQGGELPERDHSAMVQKITDLEEKHWISDWIKEENLFGNLSNLSRPQQSTSELDPEDLEEVVFCYLEQDSREALDATSASVLDLLARRQDLVPGFKKAMSLQDDAALYHRSFKDAVIGLRGGTGVLWAEGDASVEADLQAALHGTRLPSVARGWIGNIDRPVFGEQYRQLLSHVPRTTEF